MLTSNYTKTNFNFLRFFTNKESKLDNEALFKKVDEIIEKRIRPSIQADGGDITLHDIKNGCMIVSLEGACTHCPSSKSTLYHGVLGIVNDEVPEIVDIRLKLDFEDL